jgi:dihydrofolate reductase
VRTLAEHYLVDEYRLMVYPILLGQGKQLFPQAIEATPLSFVEARPSAQVVLLRLHPAGAP